MQHVGNVTLFTIFEKKKRKIEEEKMYGLNMNMSLHTRTYIYLSTFMQHTAYRIRIPFAWPQTKDIFVKSFALFFICVFESQCRYCVM